MRYNKVLLPYPKKQPISTQDQHKEICRNMKRARVHLKHLCEKTLQKNYTKMDQVMEEIEIENLKQVVKSRKEKPLEDFIMAFINRTQNPTVTQSMAHLLLLLAGDAAISSMVPFTYHYKILQTCVVLRNDLETENKLYDMKNMELNFLMYCILPSCMVFVMKVFLL